MTPFLPGDRCDTRAGIAQETSASPPWNRPEAFPERPEGHDYGFLSSGKLWPCSREELIDKCQRNEFPPIQLVWTPENERLVPPYEAAFLREPLKSRAKEHLGIEALTAVAMIALWSALLVSEPSGWPLFVALLVLTGLLPIWHLAKAWRAQNTGAPQIRDEARRVEMARFGHWIARRPQPATWLLATALLAVGAFELISYTRNAEKLSIAVKRAGLVKHHALGSEFWRLATGPMLHGHFFHLLFNLSALLVLAHLLEALGTSYHVGIVFFGAMIAGSVGSTLLLPEVTSLGASGGILGLLGFLLVLGYIKRKILPVPLYKSLLRAAVLTGLAGALAHAYIDNAAHAGGFLAGVLFGLVVIRPDEPLPLRSGIILRGLGWLTLMMTVLAAGGAAFAMSRRISDSIVVMGCAAGAATIAFRNRANASSAIPLAQPGERRRAWQSTRAGPAIRFSKRRVFFGLALFLGGGTLALLPLAIDVGGGWLVFIGWIIIWAGSVAFLWGRSFVITWLGGLLISVLVLGMIAPLVLRSRDKPHQGAEVDQMRLPIQTIPGWGEITNPDGDCTFKVESEEVTVTVPGGIHDLSPMNRRPNAPRILQEIDGDFAVVVKVSGDFEPGDLVNGSRTLPFNGAGLLLWASDQNYLRLERDAWVTPQGERASYGPLFEYWKNGKNMTPKGGTTKPFFKGRSTYLQIIRNGDIVDAAVSHDGAEWIQVDSVNAQLPKRVKIGVAAINTSNKPFSVQFAQFKLTHK